MFQEVHLKGVSVKIKRIPLLRLTEDFGQLPGQFLPSEADEVGGRYHSNVIQGEDPDVGIGAGIADGNGSRNEGP